MKELNLIVAAVLVLGLVVGSTFIVGAEQQQNSISAIGVNTNNGLGVSITTPIYSFGEVRWTANGKRKKVEKRRHYEESNYFSLQSIVYPDPLSVQGMGMQLRGGLGLKGYGSSHYKESWSSDQYFEEENREGGIYALGSIQASISLNLTRGIEAFSITKTGTPEPSPVWSLFNPIYLVFSFQGGPGWSTEAPNLKYKGQGGLSLEYRF